MQATMNHAKLRRSLISPQFSMQTPEVISLG
jgi:hypothetical protein